MACVAAALAAARGDIHWLPALITCVLGAQLMDLFYFSCGRFGGRWAIDRPPIRWLVSRERLNLAVTAFGRYGSAVLVIARFTPGLRTALQFSAGLIHESMAKAVVFMWL